MISIYLRPMCTHVREVCLTYLLWGSFTASRQTPVTVFIVNFFKSSNAIVPAIQVSWK